jgi:hypothetical protein
VTDLEQKSEKVLAKLTKIIVSMTQLEDIFTIETPRFVFHHKKSNVSILQFDMDIENNTFHLNYNSQIYDTKQITLRVNVFDLFLFFLLGGYKKLIAWIACKLFLN